MKIISRNLLASGLGTNNHILVWYLNNQTVKCDLSGHSNNVNSLELLSNGYLASASADNWIKIWNIDTCLEVKTLSPNHGGSVNALKLLDNNIMASASTDRTIRIWDTTNGNQIYIMNNNLQNFALELLSISLYK